MISYPVHTLDSAPQESRPVLEELQTAFGMVPNIAGTMAESPVLMRAFLAVFGQVHGGSFDEVQIQTLLLTNAVTNACTWAVAFHTFLALKEGMAAADVQAIRERRAPQDRKLAALSTLARAMIENRGHVQDDELAGFIEAGYTQAQALEVITVVAASTITNYVGSLTKPPLEAMFRAHAWRAAGDKAFVYRSA